MTNPQRLHHPPARRADWSWPRKIAAGIGAVVAVALLAVGGWQLHWWAALHGADNRYQVNTHAQQYQASILSQLRDTTDAYRVATDAGQRAQLKSSFCARYADLTPNTIPNDVVYAHDVTFAC